MSRPITDTARLPALDMADRPSGARLGIHDLPAGSAPFTLARIHVPPGVTTDEDHHLVREVWLVQSGSGELLVDRQPMRVTAGDSLFYDSFRRHQLRNDGEEPIEIISIWWQP
jgi:mannose-6-phosphate isomerase-like protein (cupin superfamily)